ncbi:hypothetical protein F4777DRAFT_584011 [Nemania sp. FL0916]|nr:hypothetical protein F4777DRAFT_584011 [Nemania sp. FL0916]
MEPSCDLARSRLDALPADIIFIILGCLDTARSIAYLGATCRALHQLISTEGWRIFVRSRFSSLTLPSSAHEDWIGLARTLTAQSRDWDRRAFIFHSLTPPEGFHTSSPYERRRTRPSGGQASQSIPGNVIVDAHLQTLGRYKEELVIWGAGEDVVARIRQMDSTSVVAERWHSCRGSDAGFVAGKDDTTAMFIMKPESSGDDHSPGVLVGRANGDLRLLCAGDQHFGGTLMHFRPSLADRSGICAIDIKNGSGTMMASTAKSVYLYHLDARDQAFLNSVKDPSYVDPVAAVPIKGDRAPSPFDYIRSAKMMDARTVAVALNKSVDPIHILDITPADVKLTSLPRASNEHASIGTNLRTVRALLPLDTRSAMGGGGTVLLSSWDDGTIRLQDIRTPSPVDRIYQDNFEVTAPTNALISYGLERFIAGSAYMHVLKVFDFRWSRAYYHTEALPCTNQSPYPAPTPPTIVDEPQYNNDQPLCDHGLGRLCRWHVLSRHDFYRPNYNIYLQFRKNANSPICSLAKPSDISPVVYAGLSGALSEFTLKSGMPSPSPSNPDALYTQRRGKVAVLETGDGFAVSDVSKCQRVPKIRRQISRNQTNGVSAGKWHRLDEDLQDDSEYQSFWSM